MNHLTATMASSRSSRPLLLATLLGLGLTAGSLAALHALTDPSRRLELAVLVLANLAATLLRFVVLRTVVLHPQSKGNTR